jgi:hypothetical protein
MRYMVIVKASPESENGVMPTTEELTEMGCTPAPRAPASDSTARSGR